MDAIAMDAISRSVPRFEALVLLFHFVHHPSGGKGLF
jgi:hypothetical protein